MGWAAFIYGLQLLITLLNVLQSFKAVRHQQQRNEIAATFARQRIKKRLLRAELMNWLVWISFIKVENYFYNHLGWILPLYEEVKMVLLLFFLITRTAGTTPLYNNYLRPLIAPYEGFFDMIESLFTYLVELIIWIILFIPSTIAQTWRTWTNPRIENQPQIDTSSDSAFVASEIVSRLRHVGTPSTGHPVAQCIADRIEQLNMPPPQSQPPRVVHSTRAKSIINEPTEPIVRREKSVAMPRITRSRLPTKQSRGVPKVEPDDDLMEFTLEPEPEKFTIDNTFNPINRKDTMVISNEPTKSPPNLSIEEHADTPKKRALAAIVDLSKNEAPISLPAVRPTTAFASSLGKRHKKPEAPILEKKIVRKRSTNKADSKAELAPIEEPLLRARRTVGSAGVKSTKPNNLKSNIPSKNQEPSVGPTRTTRSTTRTARESKANLPIRKPSAAANKFSNAADLTILRDTEPTVDPDPFFVSKTVKIVDNTSHTSNLDVLASSTSTTFSQNSTMPSTPLGALELTEKVTTPKKRKRVINLRGQGVKTGEDKELDGVPVVKRAKRM